MSLTVKQLLCVQIFHDQGFFFLRRFEYEMFWCCCCCCYFSKLRLPDVTFRNPYARFHKTETTTKSIAKKRNQACIGLKCTIVIIAMGPKINHATRFFLNIYFDLQTNTYEDTHANRCAIAANKFPIFGF